MTEPVIKNQTFSEPGEQEGDAAYWDVSFVSSGQGWANFGKQDSIQAHEDFDWFDKFAEIVGSVNGPFALSNREFDIDEFSYLERRFSVANVDLRKLLPPGSMVFVITTSGNDCFGGFHRVDSVKLRDTFSDVIVDRDIAYTPPTTAKLVIPPILYCDVDGYGWPAEYTDPTEYPIGTGGMVSGTNAYVTVDRGARQEIVFSGGESTVNQVLDVFNAQMIGVIAELREGQIVWKTESTGRESFLLVENGNSKLDVEGVETSGRGQFIQFWEEFFSNFSEVSSYEIGSVFAGYLQHCRVSAVFTNDGGWVRIGSEHQGEGAKLRIYGPRGALMSMASWPIAPRLVSFNDELVFLINEIHEVTVVLESGITNANKIAIEIKTAISQYDPQLDVSVKGGQIYFDTYGSVECLGGSANSDILFRENVAAYGDRVGFEIEIPDLEVYGTEGNYYRTFEDLVSVSSLFGGGGIYEIFDWGNHFDAIDDSGIETCEFTNWLVNESIGTIEVADIENNFVQLLSSQGDLTFSYKQGSKAIIEASPENDGVYTIERSLFEGGVTIVYFEEQLLSESGGGTLKPETWKISSETFEDGWGCGIKEGWRSPVVSNGRIMGRPISFPLIVQDNRNILWIGPETTEMKYIQVTSGTYETPEYLVNELNSILISVSIGELFSFGFLEVEDEQYRLTFGRL